MLSATNLFSPADGRPIVAPVQDIVLGGYYLTQMAAGDPLPYVFASPEEVLLAHFSDQVGLQQPTNVRLPDANGGSETVVTTPGRLILNSVLPESIRWVNELLDKKRLSRLVTLCHAQEGRERTIQLLDEMKTLGFAYATRAGITISMTDMDIPAKRNEIIRQTEEAVRKQNRYYETGRITQSERRSKVQELWMQAADDGPSPAGQHRPRPPDPYHHRLGAPAAQQNTRLPGARLMSDRSEPYRDLPISRTPRRAVILENFNPRTGRGRECGHGAADRDAGTRPGWWPCSVSHLGP